MDDAGEKRVTASIKMRWHKQSPADSVVTADFYTHLLQIRMTGISTGHRMEPETTAEVMLDGNDVAKLVECAIRHPAVNMPVCCVGSHLEPP
jgi:hypothetical protein